MRWNATPAQRVQPAPAVARALPLFGSVPDLPAASPLLATQGECGDLLGQRSAGLGISTDDVATLTAWARELKLDYPLLSDADGRVAQAYGVLMPGRKLALRTTFVIDRAGKIRHVEQGASAVDVTGAAAACSRLGPHSARPAR